MCTSRNKMKKVLTTLAILVGTQVWAQQNPTMDNYLFNPVSISPAYAGQQSGQIQSIYDAQWIGLKGAPRTGAMYYDYLSPTRFGFNIGVIDDQVGPMRTQSIGISTAYHLQIADEMYFATGIRYTLSNTSVDFTDDFYVDKIDQAIFNVDGPWLQNVDLAGNIYSERWYAGLTLKNMVQHELYQNNFTERVGHVFGGYRLDINKSWTVNPSMLVNVTFNAPFDANFHTFFEYEETLGLGLNLSPGDELGLFFKTNLKSGWKLFYQYNYPLSDLVYITRQSHVLAVGINLNQGSNSIISPRYFL